MAYRANGQTIYTLEKLMQRWEQDIDYSQLTPSSRRTYKLHVRQFLKWAKGEFEPGTRLERGR